MYIPEIKIIQISYKNILIIFLQKINDGKLNIPQMNSVLWGYQNNEIYRFGIQFYDKTKNPIYS